jgi:L-asparagine transporter-like permease
VLTSIGYALAVGMWMYSGYDSMSVLAGEVEEPQRVIPKGLMIAMPLIVVSYFVPTLAALGGVGRWDEWTTEGGISFVEIAEQLGGTALGVAMLVAAVVSNLALYQEYLAQGSRPAYAMAADHLLPKVLTRTHHKYGTPWVSIVVLAVINAGLVRYGFETLIVIDVFLMMFYYILIFVAARQGAGARAAVPGARGYARAGPDLRAGHGNRRHRAVHQRRRLAHRRPCRRAHGADRLPRLQATVRTSGGRHGRGLTGGLTRR